MTSIITGDIVNSREARGKDWLTDIQAVLNTLGNSPAHWEIYRGDSFQAEVPQPEEALNFCLRLKAAMRRHKGLDVRMAIGVGEKTYAAERITESNGPAFRNSGELFETLRREKTNLAIRTPDNSLNKELNLMFRLALRFMDNWTPRAAELITVLLNHPNLNQQEIGKQLGISQPTVSEAQVRAGWAEIRELDAMYRMKVRSLL